MAASKKPTTPKTKTATTTTKGTAATKTEAPKPAAKAPSPVVQPPAPASLLDPARVEWKLGRFGVATGRDLKDPALWQRCQEYRRLVASRLSPLEKKDVRGRLPAGEYHLSRKVDGEHVMLVYSAGEALLISPGGMVRVGLPLLGEAIEKLGKAGVKSALIAGELYYRRADGRPRVFDVSRAARQPEGQDDVERLGLAVFDLIEVDGQPAGAKHADVFARIQRLFAGGERVHPVDAATVKTPEEIEKFYGSWVEEQGAEGLVLRSDSAGGFKLKPRHTLDAVVVGFTESDEDRKGMVHDLLLAVMRKDGSLHLIGRVGNGFSDDERRAMLSDLKDLATESDYAEIGEGHIAYQMVRPELVIEITCLDLISQTTRGGSIDKMVLDWDAAAKRYRPLRRMPMVSLIAPVFVRRREDKRVNATDVRAQQIGDLVEVPRLEVDARAVTLPKSEVLRREVYVKTQKGQTLVRKFLMWKTNKEDSGDFPAYVLHFTDYSPTRKTPLEREIRVSSSREQIEALFTELHKENVVKGWAKA